MSEHTSDNCVIGLEVKLSRDKIIFNLMCDNYYPETI